MMRRSLSHRAPAADRSGLSRVEVILGTIVVLVLVCLAVPFVLYARESARRSQCAYQLAQIGQALRSYHDVHGQLPPAGLWNTQAMESLALHKSRRWDLFIEANWAILLLPHLQREDLLQSFDPAQPISSPANEKLRAALVSDFRCPSDEYNRPDNPYAYEPIPGRLIEFARGNYAINGGTNSWYTDAGSTSSPTGDHAHLVIDPERREFRYWGNGIAGFNQSFRMDDFANGQSTLVAFDEIRAGIDPIDPRGVWALGQIASSATWGHGVNGDDYGPNNPWARSDDIQGCPELNDRYGPDELIRLGMPCVSYLDENQNATARSRHPGGVNVAFLDGSVRFVSNNIAPALWHVLHSRETPADVLQDSVPGRLNWSGSTAEAPKPLVATRRQDEAKELTNSLGMRFVLIPAGEFMMGVPDQGNDRDVPPETPAHRVRITQPFYLDCCEVTQEQFQLVMGANPSWHQPPRAGDDWSPQFPVNNVTWQQADEFCRRLSERTDERAAGRVYRLPTEAEWEYACRAGSSTPFRWTPRRMADDSSGFAAGMSPALPVKPVGSYAPNAFGLYDLRGNVWEWCSDWFDRDYYARSPVDDPQGPAEGYLKVVRGGDWIYVGEGCFINYPILAPWKASPFIGFRVVCEAARALSAQ